MMRPAALDHVVESRLGHAEQAVEIGVDHGLPIRLRHFPKGLVARDACVVTCAQNVRLPPLNRRGVKVWAGAEVKVR